MITYCFQRCHSANIYCVTHTGPVSSAGLPESRLGRAVSAMVTGPGGGGGAAELRPSAAQQQLMSVIDFAGCGTVRRTSDSSTTTHSFLHHATKTQQQLNLETVGWPHQQRAHCEGHSLGGGSVRAVRGGRDGR